MTVRFASLARDWKDRRRSMPVATAVESGGQNASITDSAGTTIVLTRSSAFKAV